MDTESDLLYLSFALIVVALKCTQIVKEICSYPLLIINISSLAFDLSICQ